MKWNDSRIYVLIMAGFSIFFFLILPVVDLGWLGSANGLKLFSSKFDSDYLPYYSFLVVPVLVGLIYWNVRIHDRFMRVSLAALMLLPVVISYIGVAWKLASYTNSFVSVSDVSRFVGPGYWVYLVISIILVIVVVMSDGPDDEAITPTDNRPKEKFAPAIHGDEVRRTYSTERLEEVIANAQLYNPTLVERCKTELSVRQDAENLKPQVMEFADEKVDEILRSPDNYSPAVVYCCQCDKERRDKERAEKLHQKALEAQKRYEEEAERKAQERAAFFKKYQWCFYGGAAVIAVIAFLIYWFSDGRYYEKGMAACEEEDYDTAIEYLSGVSDGYKDYPTANWRLFCSYLVKNDSASAAQCLLNAVANGDWDKQPEASRKYCEYVVSEQFAPYIKSNVDDYVKCADLMSMAYLDEDAEKIRVGAGELYHSVYKEKEAVRIFSSLASVNDDSYAAKVANGYLGVYYLYGLGGMEKNLNEAQKYLKCAADNNSLFEKCRTITALASMTTPNYSIIRELSSSLSPSTPSKTVLNVLEKLLAAEKKHRSQWVGHDSEWNNYSYSNGDGHYEGEYESYGYLNGGSAKGWGVFVYKGDNNGDKYRTITMGKFFPKGKSCLLQGDGIYLYYELQSGKFSVNVGRFNDGYMQTGETWSSWSDEDIKKIHELKTFHCVPQPKKVLIGRRWL